LVCDPGLGKSRISLDYVNRNKRLRPVVIVCPAPVKWQWEEEALKHFGMRVTVLEGTKPKRLVKKLHPVIVLNSDILYAWVDALKRVRPQVVVGDEGQQYMSPKSRRCLAMRSLCEGVPSVLFLSGTPFLNRVIEMFPTLNILKPKTFPNIFAFGHKFCGARKNPFGRWEFNGASRTKELNRLLLSSCMFRRKRDDVLESLPAKVRTVIPVKLPASAMAEYEKADEDFLNWVRDKSPARLAGALRSEGIVKIGMLKRLAAKLKLPFVMGWEDEFMANPASGKLITFAVHKDVVKELASRHSETTVVIDGSVTGKKREAARYRFQHDKGCRRLVGNIKAAGTGLNLDAASHVLKAEYWWNAATHVQAEDRAYARVGNPHGVNVVYMAAKGTCEERIVKLIQKRAETSAAVLDGDRNVRPFSIYDELVRQIKNGKWELTSKGVQP
jgi:SWI/SNF-related matrix-associated actin-dependent regulator of chromatin subfamily A-like protein 1